MRPQSVVYLLDIIEKGLQRSGRGGPLSKDGLSNSQAHVHRRLLDQEGNDRSVSVQRPHSQQGGPGLLEAASRIAIAQLEGGAPAQGPRRLSHHKEVIGWGSGRPSPLGIEPAALHVCCTPGHGQGFVALLEHLPNRGDRLLRPLRGVGPGHDPAERLCR